MTDPTQIPGYAGQLGPPDDYVPDTRMWTRNLCDNARFGTVLRPDGFMGIASLHPMRAMELAGTFTTIPGTGFATWWSGNLTPIDKDNDVEHTFTGLTPAQTDTVRLEYSARGDFGTSTEYVTVTMDGALSVEAGRILDTNGRDHPAVTQDAVLPIDADDFNRALGAGDSLVFRFVCSSYVGAEPGSFIKCRLVYTVADTVTYGYTNREVCMYHNGLGFLVGGDGFVRPVTVIQPDRYESPLLSVGAGWVTLVDEPDAHGPAGMTALALPVQTPPIYESVFAAHPKVCGSPE